MGIWEMPRQLQAIRVLEEAVASSTLDGLGDVRL